jgi:hypothetical protein
MAIIINVGIVNGKLLLQKRQLISHVAFRQHAGFTQLDRITIQRWLSKSITLPVETGTDLYNALRKVNTIRTIFI